MSTQLQPLRFDCEGDTLVGVLHRPQSQSQSQSQSQLQSQSQSQSQRSRGVLIVVGGPQYRVGSHRQFVLMARDLAARGFPVLRFDYRGMGDSEGVFRGFEHVGADIDAALAAFREHCPGLEDVVLWGLCDGASAAVFRAAGRRQTALPVAGLILANPWVRTEQGLARAYVGNYYGRRLMQASFWKKLLSGDLRVGAALAGFLIDVRRALGMSGKNERTSDRINEPANDRAGGPAGSSLDQPLPERLRQGLGSFRGRVLLVLSGNDLTAREFAACAEAPAWKTVMSRGDVERFDMPASDHTFSRRRWLDELSARCADWLSR